MAKTFVIGIMGETGAGKTSLAALLGVKAGYIPYAFADHLKEQCARAFDVTVEVFNSRAVKNTPLNQLSLSHCKDQGFVSFIEAGANAGLTVPRTPRSIMLWYSDWVKLDSKNPSYFIDKLLDDIHGNPTPLVVVSDVRYVTEVSAIKREFSGSLFVHLTRHRNPYREEGRARHESDRDMSPHADVCLAMPGEDEAELLVTVNNVLAAVEKKLKALAENREAPKLQQIC